MLLVTLRRQDGTLLLRKSMLITGPKALPCA